MKHTTRKKMLLSSVAMLLVAMLALGSATFAWFTSNPNASANGLSLKTTASTGLVVLSGTQKDIDGGSWSHYTTLNAINEEVGSGNYKYKSDPTAFNLTPVSQKQNQENAENNDPTKFFTATAAESGKFGADTSGASTATGGYYSENIYCRLSDGSDATAAANSEVYLKGVTITKATNATMEGCIRVAVANGKTLLGTYALSSSDPNGVLTPDAGAFNPTLATASSSLNVATGLKGLSAAADNYDKYLTVYVYLDGQDKNCFSDNVGVYNAQQIISSIQLDLQLVTPAPSGE